MKPFQAEGIATLYIATCDVQTKLHGQLEVASREEVSFLCQSGMGGNKVFARDAILIGKDKIVCRSGLKGFIEYFRFLEASVLVP